MAHVRWQNFRSFVDTGPLELAPITILIGSNSSGKTSLILPLLLMKQTLDADDASIGLVTRGRLANLGSYDDLIYRHNRRGTLLFTVRFGEFARRAESDPPPAEAEMSLRPGRGGDEIVLTSYTLRNEAGRQMFNRTRKAGGEYDIVADRALGRSVVARAIRQERPRHFMFDGQHAFSAMVQMPRRRALNIKEPGLRYLSAAGWSAGAIESMLERISYIGPLRDRPRRRYELSEEHPADVGTHGEKAPEILFRNQNTELIKTVEGWLRQFDAARSVAFSSFEDVFSMDMCFSRNVPSVSFADTGFGVSQILPLIVEGFSSSPGSLIIAEQPEIHLNPRYQAKLANLFADIASRGITVVLETHSEHLLLRLRTLVASGDVSASDVALYFVEKTRGRSEVRRVPIQENGHIETSEWPDGFFAEPLKDAMRLAQLQRDARAK